MNYPDGRWLVETSWLADRLSAPDLVVLDASWHLPSEGRDAAAAYRQAHIPGAAFFDIDALSDPKSGLPHMLPEPAMFASRMRHMGVGDGMRILIYDSKGLYSAARVWWTFRVMGHDDVAVLNGGLPKWLAEGRTIEEGEAPAWSPRHFTVRRNSRLVADRHDVSAALSSGAAQVVDARSPGRFAGEEVEPRPGVRRGHAPGARNLHYARLVAPDFTMRSPEDLRRAFEAAGVDLARPVITSCGSGITAAIIALSLSLLGHERWSLYDGSWAEWGADAASPVVAGAA